MKWPTLTAYSTAVICFVVAAVLYALNERDAAGALLAGGLGLLGLGLHPKVP